MKRYILQKRVEKDDSKKLEVWKNVMQHDNLTTLSYFMGHGYRVFDTQECTVITTNNTTRKPAM